MEINEQKKQAIIIAAFKACYADYKNDFIRKFKGEEAVSDFEAAYYEGLKNGRMSIIGGLFGKYVEYATDDEGEYVAVMEVTMRERDTRTDAEIYKSIMERVDYMEKKNG